MKNKIIPTEFHEQKAYLQWFNLYFAHLKPKPFIFAIPNERTSNVQHLVKLKAQGVVFGMPDLMILHSSLGFFGLGIELKRTKNSKVSENQKAVHKQLADAGYCVVVAYGCEEAINYTKAYFLGNGKEFGRAVTDKEIEKLQGEIC